MSLNIIETSSLWLTIVIDENPWKTVSKSLFQKQLSSLIYQGDLKALEAAFLALECKVAKSYAVYLLSKKAYFSLELIKKLKSKKISEEAAREALSFLKKKALLKEEPLIESFIKKKMEKGYSASFAKRALKEKAGLSIESPSYLDESVIIKKLYEKKFKGKELNTQGKQRVFQFFLRRGFHYETISSALSDLLLDGN